jgi:hypothetical protein
MMCRECEELSEERYPVYISEIRTSDCGYYFWHREIKYCPTCGKRIIYGQKREKKEK